MHLREIFSFKLILILREVNVVRNLKEILMVGLTLLSFSTLTVANDNNILPNAQKQQIEKIVHDYLVSNPQVLIEVSQSLQQQQQQKMMEAAEKAIDTNSNDLFADNLTTVGNPKGNVTLVEFFDYQCGHCKQMTKVIDTLVAKNPQLRVIYKEFPIFGGSSDLAAKAALAAALQGKYQTMHTALLHQDKPLTSKSIMELAKKNNLDVKKLKQDMDAKNIMQILTNNRQLAEKLNLMGTPAFIVASTPTGKLDAKVKPGFIPGAANEQVLQSLINKASKKV